MKKLFFLISFLALCAFASDMPVPTVVYAGYVVTSSGTTEVELQFSDLSTFSSVHTLVYVQTASTNSGTIQFSAGHTIDANYAAWPAGSRIPITISNGYRNLRYKASASSQSFYVTH